MKRVLGAFMLLALAACGPSPQAVSNESTADMRMVAGKVAADAPATEAAAPPPPPGAPPSPGAPPGNLFLAYAYTYGMEAPAKAVQPLMKKHEDECVKAGPALCQVLGENTDTIGENNVQGQLQLRAEPRWLATFRDKLAGDAKGVGGVLKSKATTTEDLTRQIVDTEARLRAGRTLRDRLQALLASRPGKLSDLLDVERELARVQGEIDATESNLAVMRTRVAMSLATLNYASAGAPLTDQTFEPIKDALTNFMRIVSSVIGALIIVVAAVLPLIPIAWGVWWLIKRRNKRVVAAKPASENVPT